MSIRPLTPVGGVRFSRENWVRFVARCPRNLVPLWRLFRAVDVLEEDSTWEEVKQIAKEQAENQA
jgi:hypothetical protein